MKTFCAYFAYFAPAPTEIRPRRAPHIDEIGIEEQTPEEPRRATAAGTPDEFCHILDALGYTLCGQRLRPPAVRTHGVSDPPWCPNGHPSCPDCARIHGS